MDRRSSGRFSLNGSQFNNLPIAESTQIHGNSFTGSPRQSLGNNSFSNNSPNRGRVQKTNMSPAAKIDQRIYTDVLSRGLASRIVQYHDSTTRRMNRSLTGANAYNKPGQFPIVHLNAKEQICKPPKNQNLSMVRIPPPERSVFQGNTLSGLLRSGSIVPSVNHTNANSTAKYLNGTVHENQPILHPLQNNTDLQPTRSVLEDLKAISRKRINNDELDSREITKKFKDIDEEAAAAAAAASASSSLPDPHMQSSKRQRDQQSSPQQSGISAGDISPSEKQVVKKRLYTKNNEILSSLSSSLILLTPKRKNLEQQFRQEEDLQKEKQQRNNDRIELPKLPDGETWSIPEEEENTAEKEPHEESIKSNIEESTLAKPIPKVTLFNKNYDDCEVRKIPFEDENTGKIPFIKPKKMSSFPSKNFCKEKAQQIKLEMMLKGLKGELDKNDDDVVDCPKEPELVKVSSVAPTLTPAITTTASVLTAPVSFGDVKSSSTPTPASNSFSFGTTAVSSNTTPALSAPTTSVQVPSLKVAELPSKQDTPKPEASTTTFNFGASKPSTTSSVALSTTTSSLVVTTTTAVPTKAIAPISFGTPSTTPSLQLPTTSAPDFKSSALTTQAFTASTTPAPAFGSNTSFGAPNSSASLVLGTIKPTAAFSLGSSLNSAPLAVSSSGTSTGTTASGFGASGLGSSTSKAPAFGSSTSNAPTFGSSTSNAPTFGSSTSNAPTFGSSTSNAPTFGNTSSNSTAFGSSTSNPTPTFGASKPEPAFVNTSKTNPNPSSFVSSSNTFGSSSAFGPSTASSAFGSSTTSTKPSTEARVFGSGTSSSANPTNNSVFGSAATVTTAQSNFSFGSASNTTAPSFGSTSVFGGPAAQNKLSTSGGFSFSSPNVNSNNKPVAFGGSTQEIKASQPTPPSGGFSFGGSNTSQTQNSFGGNSAPPTQNPSKPFGFGGSTESSAPKAGGFSFGGANTAQSASSSPFNSNSTPSFGGNKPEATSTGNSFVFGKANSDVNKPTTTVSPFGGSTAQSQQSSGFGSSFGGPTSSTSNAFAFAASTASSASQNSSQTGFGQPQTSSNIFGSAGSTSNNNFGSSSAATTTNVFGNKSAPSFGSVSQNNNAQSNAPNFVFGGGANAPNGNSSSQGNSQAFAFGSNSQPQNQSNTSATNAFQFGSGATTTNNASSAFNFSAGGAGNVGAFGVNSQQGNAFAPNPSNNLFNPGPSDQRPIRKATRRMQK
ncbi:hypothetical protein ACFFRR_000514 [Megaselia abdita]